MRATSLVIVLAGGIALHCATTAGAAVNNCTSRAAQATVKKDGRTLQTLRSGQYYAYRHAGGQWTICDGKRKGRSAFGTIGLDVNGQKNTGVRLLSQAGRCLAFELRRSGPASRAIPSAPTVDMRPGKAIGGLIHPIDFAAPGAVNGCGRRATTSVHSSGRIREMFAQWPTGGSRRHRPPRRRARCATPRSGLKPG